MNRPVAIAVVVAFLIALLVGYLWWGLPAQRMQDELRQARERVETVDKQLGEAEARIRAAEAELRALEPRLKAAEEELALERQRRSRLEGLLSRGRK